uniref:Guanine nucleotide-binding protein alpha-2 subunit n=1 Tax=Blastobotrys adeninivorans TaxID=409370 RepID=A0A060T1L1_BLAAD
MGSCLSSSKNSGQSRPERADEPKKAQGRSGSMPSTNDNAVTTSAGTGNSNQSGGDQNTSQSGNQSATGTAASNVNSTNVDSSASQALTHNPGQANGHSNNQQLQQSTQRSMSSSSASSSSNKQEIKILLLGSGESGKSTILKQMKIIHQNGYSQEELLMYKTTVYKNLMDCAKAIVEALDTFNLSVAEPQDNAAAVSKEELEYLMSYTIQPDPDTILDARVPQIITNLWAHPVVKKMFVENRSQFYIMDSAPYFFTNVDRIGSPEYIPTVPDILRARIKTTGIYETRFEMGGMNILMYDVGGQRSERKKWIHCFDNVTLIIFCVALSEYDQGLLEEKSQNRMAESLVLFDSVVNSRWFMRTSVVLFLNKIDVFTEKLPHSPLENYFPDYKGGNDINNAAKYILWRFTSLNRANLNIYPHLTQATDTSNIRLVFAAVKETILQNALRDSGIL